MVILCPKCGSELKATLTICPNCGAMVDLYSRDYEQHMVAIIADSSAARRAQICLDIGVPRKAERDSNAGCAASEFRCLGTRSGFARHWGNRGIAISAVEKLTVNENDGPAALRSMFLSA
jgi:hypothetical protein